MLARKVVSYALTLLAVATLWALFGLIHSFGAHDGAARVRYMVALKWCFGAMAAAAVYMAAIGLYHTFLAVFGLDGGPGILRKNPHYVPGSDEPQRDGTPIEPS